MIPPRGFRAEQYPLRHRLVFSAGLSAGVNTLNTVFLPIVMSSSDTDVVASTIQVNPHNTNYEEDAGPLVRVMSILDRMRISLKFNLTAVCNDLAETASGTFTGDGIPSLRLLWRPIFGAFTEKLNATDDDLGTTVASMLGLTVDATNEDVVPITTNKLPTTGSSDLALPVSSVNAVQIFSDFNMTTDTTMEDHVHDENTLQSMLRRSTVKGALRSFMGRTRHVILTRNRPYKSFFLDKFLPSAIRRVNPFTFFGIQVHVPAIADVEQAYHHLNASSNAHIGVKCIVNYHEWNIEHDQDMTTGG